MGRSTTDLLKSAAISGLIGEVPSNLYAIAADLEGGLLRAFFYYYNNPRCDDIDQMYLIGTNIAASTPIDAYWWVHECPALMDEYGRLPKLVSIYRRADESKTIESIEPDEVFSEVDLKQMVAMEILPDFRSHACDALLGNVTGNMHYIVVGITEDHEIIFIFGFHSHVQPIDTFCSKRILYHIKDIYKKPCFAVCTYDAIYALPEDKGRAIYNTFVPVDDEAETVVRSDNTVSAVTGIMEKSLANSTTQEIIKREFLTRICTQITSSVYAVNVDFVGDYIRVFVFFYNTPNQADATYISDALSRFRMAPGPDVVAIASAPAMTKSEYGLLSNQQTVYLRSDESVVLDKVNAADVFSELSLQDLTTISDPDKDFFTIYSHLCDALLGNITGNMQAIFLTKITAGAMALLFCFEESASASDISCCKRILDHIRMSLLTECYAVSWMDGIDSIPAEKVVSIFQIYEPEVPEYLLNPDI